jgi:hypothetical protein
MKREHRNNVSKAKLKVNKESLRALLVDEVAANGAIQRPTTSAIDLCVTAWICPTRATSCL